MIPHPESAGLSPLPPPTVRNTQPSQQSNASARRAYRRAAWASALCLALGALGMTGCSGPTEYSDAGPGVPQSLPVNSLQQQWSTKLTNEHGPVNHLYASDKLVFAYADDGTSFVMDRASGRILHVETVHNGAQALHPPVVFKDFIVYPTTTTLEIYDHNGLLVNSKDLGYAIRSDAVGTRDYVYLGADFSTGGRIVCIDVTDRYLDHKWYLMFPGVSISAAPVIVGDIVYVAGENDQVAAVTYDTRVPIWTLPGGAFHTYGPNYANLAGDESGIYVASSDTYLYALVRASGRVKWQYAAQTELRTAPVVSKDLVYQFVPGTGLVAIDKLEKPGKSGLPQFNRSPRWVAPDCDKFLAEDDKYSYLRRTDNTIVAMDKTNGHVAFASKRHDFRTFWSNNRDATIYAGTVANRIMAITPVLKPGVVGELVFEPVVDPSRALVAGPEAHAGGRQVALRGG